MKRIFFLICYFLFLISNLSAQKTIELTIQRGHYSSLRATLFHPEKPIVITAANDGLIKFWDILKGTEIKTLVKHNAPVSAMDISADGQFLASGAEDGSLYIWQFGANEPIKELLGMSGKIISLKFSDDASKLLVSGKDRRARLFDVTSGKVIKEWKVDPGQFGANSDWSSNGKWVAFGNDDAEVYVVDAETDSMRIFRDIESSYCGGCVSRVAFSENSNELLTAVNNGAIQLWDVKEGKVKMTMKSLEERPVALGISDKRNHAFVATKDSVFIFDTRRGRKKWFFKPHEKSMGYAKMSADGRLLLTAGNDETAVLWDIDKQQKIKVYEGWLKEEIVDGLDLDPDEYWESYHYQLLAYKNQVAISPDGKWLARGRIGKDVNIWNLQNGRWVKSLKGHNKTVTCMAYSHDGTKLITGSADERAILWDLESGDSLHVWKHNDHVMDVVFSNDQKKVATASYDGYVRVFDVISGALLSQFETRSDPKYYEVPYTISFTPNDLYLVIGTTANNLQLWELDTGKPFRTYIGHTDLITGIAIDQSTGRFFSTSWDDTFREWDLLTGYQYRKYNLHKGNVNDITLASHHPWVLSGGSDRKVILWDKNTGEKIRSFIGHQNAVTSVHFINNDSLVLSYTIDGEMKVWDTFSGNLLYTQYFVGEKDWLSVDPLGFFYATERARDNIYFVKDFKTYEPDQFFRHFFKPDVVKDAIEGKYRANESGLYQRLEDHPIPSVAFVNPKSDFETQQEQIDIMIKATNNGGGIKDVVIKQNGKRLEVTSDVLFDKVKSGKSIIIDQSIKLVPGFNQIEITAANDAGIEAGAKTLLINNKASANKPNCYLLAVGINSYENESMNLNYAKRDAQDFVKHLKSNKGTLYGEVQVLTLYDKHATKSKLEEYLDYIAKVAKPNDVFMMYYAGHGSLIDDEFYLIPADCKRLYDSGIVQKSALSSHVLQSKLTKVQALKQVIIMDACQSGAGAAVLAVRGGIEERAIAQLSRSAGVHVLASSGSDQYAIEFDELGHGLFTYVLLKAMEGEADGSPKDGQITVYEIKSFLDALVPEYSEELKGAAQYPFTFSKGSDFPLVIE